MFKNFKNGTFIHLMTQFLITHNFFPKSVHQVKIFIFLAFSPLFQKRCNTFQSWLGNRICFWVKPMLRNRTYFAWTPIKNENTTSFQIEVSHLSKEYFRFFRRIFLRLESVLACNIRTILTMFWCQSSFTLQALQYTCTEEMGGPPGCLQYFTASTGTVASFNFPTTATSVTDSTG